VPDQPVTGTDPATDPSVTPDPAPPVDPADFDFLTQGLTGVVRKQDLDTLRGPQAKGNGKIRSISVDRSEQRPATWDVRKPPKLERPRRSRV
jgi:hypothetical protein